MRRLPEAEFEVMSEIWKLEPPVTTHMLMETVGAARGWKAPSLITLLNRLIERGFLSTGKRGKERFYMPLVTREEYLRFETQGFLERMHGNSLTSFLQAVHGGAKLSRADIEQLRAWMDEELGKNG